ncbi:MAG: sulfite exporter TauE/SafE family protein [Syntrophales bacterium]
MLPDHLYLFIAAVLVVAFLYSSVGHAGASGYIAVMAIFGLAPVTIKPVALALNILVASLGVWQFRRAGNFSWRLFWPFAVLSVPFAFIGGALNLPTHAFRVAVGIVLLFSALRFFIKPAEEKVIPPSILTSLGVGAGLGLLSGLTGTGGGVFLTPLLLFMGWARTRVASGVSALFILVNSSAGLMGNLAATHDMPLVAASLALAAVAGGWLGSYLGSNRFSVPLIRQVLAVVMVLAGCKLIWT